MTADDRRRTRTQLGLKVPKVFISGPYKSNPVRGVQEAIKAATQLRRNGFLPFVPHLTMLWDLVSPMPEIYYLEMDLDWLADCDAVLRLGGESAGADTEVARARELGISVFYSIDELLEWAPQ